jgi:hypothetical protein
MVDDIDPLDSIELNRNVDMEMHREDEEDEKKKEEVVED